MDFRNRRLAYDATAIRRAAQQIRAQGTARRAERMEAEAREMEARLIREHALALAEEGRADDAHVIDPPG